MHLYYRNNFPVLVSLVTTISVFFINMCLISPTPYSNSFYFVYYQTNLNLYKLLAGVHIKQSLYSSCRHWEFLMPNLNSFLHKYFAFKKNFPAWTSSEATCNRQYMWCLGRQQRIEKQVFTFSIPWHVQNVHVAQADIRHLKQKTC